MEWVEHAACLVETLKTPRFPGALAEALQAVAPYDYTVIFGYVGSSKPLALYDDFTPKRHRLHVTEYLEGPYLLDPFFLATIDDTEEGLWRLREIAPDRFYQGEYYRSYYGQTGLAEEIGFLVHADRRLNVVISLMRKQKRFSSAEIRALKRIWPIIRATSEAHWRGFARDDEDGEQQTREERIEQAFHSIGQGVLTPREREVVEMTLRGHSAEATGNELGISPGTVRIHRRNIYVKLRIGSQGELFSLFINAILNDRADNATRATALL
ncbi:LuxR C-terminal-related transcriptional regulator [uncultured Roseobacter sp.]|uniref:LuxR C-terminal-related transcriptional regulator n=1 Tax=uncultured Roseobacter sp. TaxID=114847 RepID=UPI00262C523A|nr:LuxR C-terminal-related transcriptional regulator [uncultured Roseobacter sp.]